jgi:hypothetical protein
MYIVVTLAVLTSLGRGHCQEQEVPLFPAPATAVPETPECPRPEAPHGLLPDPAAYPHAPCLPVGGPAACAPYEDCNGNLLKGDPFLDPQDLPPPGWFGTVEVDVIGPHLKNRLNSSVALEVAPRSVMVVGASPKPLQLPGVELDWTAAPRFELGYRLPEGFGEFLLAYRFLATDGRAAIPNTNGIEGFLRTRLEMDVVDLAYASREVAVLPGCDMRWYVGARLGHIYFDNRGERLFAEARTSNSFLGAGPLAALELRHRCGSVPGLDLFVRTEGAIVVGRIKQSFEETVSLGGGAAAGGAASANGSQTSPVLHIKAGLGYQAAWGSHPLRFALGYNWEQWWLVGRLGDSRADLTDQGIFVRAEFNY